MFVIYKNNKISLTFRYEKKNVIQSHLNFKKIQTHSNFKQKKNVTLVVVFFLFKLLQLHTYPCSISLTIYSHKYIRKYSY